MPSPTPYIGQTEVFCANMIFLIIHRWTVANQIFLAWVVFHWHVIYMHRYIQTYLFIHMCQSRDNASENNLYTKQKRKRCDLQLKGSNILWISLKRTAKQNTTQNRKYSTDWKLYEINSLFLTFCDSTIINSLSTELHRENNKIVKT